MKYFICSNEITESKNGDFKVNSEETCQGQTSSLHIYHA